MPEFMSNAEGGASAMVKARFESTTSGGTKEFKIRIRRVNTDPNYDSEVVSLEVIAATSNPSPILTQTPSPSPSPLPAPTPVKTSTPTKTPTPKPSPKEEIVLESQTSNSDQVLGLREQLKTLEPEGDEESPKKKFPVLPVILIIFGAGLMGFAGYTLFKKMKTEGYNNQSEENN